MQRRCHENQKCERMTTSEGATSSLRRISIDICAALKDAKPSGVTMKITPLGLNSIRIQKVSLVFGGKRRSGQNPIVLFPKERGKEFPAMQDVGDASVSEC